MICLEIFIQIATVTTTNVNSSYLSSKISQHLHDKFRTDIVVPESRSIVLTLTISRLFLYSYHEVVI